MKKIYLSLLLSGSTFMGLQAQLAPGTPAPDFTATDLNGVSHTLSSYLAAGKSVIIDVSATWCGPCWSYHSSHELAEFYKAYGPDGSDEVMVFFVEGDNATTVANLNGTGNTQGNWVEGTPYPILDNSSIADAYAITYFPTLYRICPDGLAYEINPMSAAQLKAEVNTNCGTMTGVANHAEIEGSEIALCSTDGVATATLANFGTNAITSATVLLKENGTTVNTANFSGNVAQFSTGTVTFPSASYNLTSNYTVELTNVNSGAPFNPAYSVAGMSVVSANLTGVNITVKVFTDNYPSETTWEIRNSSTNTVVASGGPYIGAGGTAAGGPDALQTKTHNVTLPAGNNCYKITMADGYGDGFGYGTNPAGQYGMEIVCNGASVINLALGNFGTNFVRDAAMKTDATSSVFELNTDVLNVYPNPASDELFVQFEALASDYTVSISDLQGRMIYATDLNGVSGTQNVSVPVKEFSKGSYIVNVTSMGVTKTQHVVIK